MQCLHCQFTNPDEMKYCGQCATPLRKRCPNCQFENPSDFLYCGQCATALSTTETHQAVAQAVNAVLPNTASNHRNQRKHSSIPEPSLVHPALNSNSHQEAERRQLTVLFCDIVGSTALSEAVDPEDLREIMNDYRNTCDDIISRMGGHVAQYLGDGVLAYFGYPQANEYDARRAVQTGLELLNGMSALNVHLLREKNVSLSIRVGIHTGLVVVGKLTDGEKRSLALGETPNIAATIQCQAETNSVVISAATFKLVDRYFRCTPLGEQKLKGFSRPIILVKVIEKVASPYPGGTTMLGQTPLVGRRQESALLEDRLEQAKQGQGQVVLLNGEAGIGKSRLIEFVRDKAATDPHYMIECWGTEYHQNSFLHGIVDAGKRSLGFDDHLSAEEQLKILETPLSAFGMPIEESLPLLANLFSVPLPEDRFPALNLTPQQRKQKLLQALVTYLVAMSTQRLLILVFEDLHWVDQTTLELIDMLIDQAPTNSVLLLLTFRQEFTPSWTARSHLTHISINRLTRDQSSQIVKWVANNKELPQGIVEQILNKTDGIPFFVEELTRMFLETNSVAGKHKEIQLAGPHANLSIPSTLQDSLMARLDNLGPGKELAQISATIGREFSYKLLQSITPYEEKELELRLSQLVFSELLYQRGVPPEANYTFRHALVHEVAYYSLLKKTRQYYHANIANALLEKFPRIEAENPEILAHHFREANEQNSAVKYRIKAGQLAMQRFANLDAIAHFTQALQSISKLPKSQESAELEFKVQASLGLASMLCKGYAAPEVESAYARAYALGRNIGENSTTFPVLSGLWEFYLVRAELDIAKELSNQMRAIADESQSETHLLEAQRASGATHFWLGNITKARQCLQEAIKRRNKNGVIVSGRTQSFSQDTEVGMLSTGACVLWLAGLPDQAIEQATESVQIAKQLNHPFSLAYAYHFLSIIHQLRYEPLETEKCAKKTIEVSTEYKFTFWKATGTMLLSWAKMQQNPDEEQKRIFDDAHQLYCSTGGRLALSYFQSISTELDILLENFISATAIVDKTFGEMNKYNERFFEAELFRLKANIYMYQKNKNINKAEELLHRAILIAEKQQAKSLKLRATYDLCSIWQNQGRLDKCVDILAEELNGFKEGITVRDWKRANNLLQKSIKQNHTLKQVEPL